MDPRDVQIILGNNLHLEKSSEYTLFEPWLGDGLLISKGEKWKSHRKMIAPTFHSSILKTFVPVFNRNAERLVANLKKELDYKILETAMGVQKTDEDNTGYEYAMAVMKMCNILHLRTVKYWLRPDFIFKYSSLAGPQKFLLNVIHTLTRKVMKTKKQDFLIRQQEGKQSLYLKAVDEDKNNEENGTDDMSLMNNYVKDDLEENDDIIGEKKRLAFLDFLIEASQSTENNLSDKDINEEVNTIMFEASLLANRQSEEEFEAKALDKIWGHDTTAAASSFALCLLGTHQDIQDKVFQELKDIFQGDLYRPVTFRDTIEMKYLERVILETLRLYPPVPMIARTIREDVKLASGDYTIPAGATAVVVMYCIHRQSKYYPNPETFDPDNFLPERCLQRPPYSFIPFSAGPRSCVGRKYAMLKLKILLAHVLRKYKVVSTIKESEYTLQGDIILKREEGFLLQIEERTI
ncbi:hypothetical protein NQ317_016364 [Molorchus minor]|uniref:Cytochrome P450 n=1 Tax=Molorchus minor TaxID=1323400 RepID=A0ABQ9JEC8_9CUCU|nr:hypothetical protein NQ317_016364 [Molorchus minor]